MECIDIGGISTLIFLLPHSLMIGGTLVFYYFLAPQGFTYKSTFSTVVVPWHGANHSQSFLYGMCASQITGAQM